jgi:hypothetical protein
VRGAHVTLGPKAITKTVGLPGTGVFYTSRSGSHSGVHSAHSSSPLGAFVIVGVMVGAGIVACGHPDHLLALIR